MFSKMLKRLRSWLRYSPYVHIHEPLYDIRSLIGVMDRFVDGVGGYDLEWDDFISWQSKNPNIEEIRKILEPYEVLLLSSDRDANLLYRNKVVELRNIAAAKIGYPQREDVTELHIPGRNYFKREENRR